MDCVVPLKSEFDHAVCPPPNTNHQMSPLTMHAGLTMPSDTLQPPPQPQLPAVDQQKYQPDVATVSNQLNAYDVKGKFPF